MVDFSLSGQRALITGASRGIGRAIAVGFARRGVDLALLARSEGVLETARKCRSYDVAVTVIQKAVPKDVSESHNLVDETDETIGPINILINNAGTLFRSPSIEYPLDQWNEVLTVNLSSVFLLCQSFGSEMINRGKGKIINIASIVGYSGGLNISAYAASKGGLIQLTKSLANEWASKGVNVNAIAPGYTKTSMTADLRQNQERYTELSARIPAGRWGEPEDLVGPAIFLASDASDYVHGHVLVVDGGWMAF